MADIVERLEFDTVRCELQFSKGVAGNIREAADEIEQLRSQLADAETSLRIYDHAGSSEYWLRWPRTNQ